MATCYQKHPFEIEKEDHLTTINTKIFEIKKKIQLSEGQRKSIYEENEAEKQQNNDLIETLKKEIRVRIKELAQARALIGEDEVQIKKYLNEITPIGKKSSDQIIHNLDLKVIEQRKLLDLLKYERKNKKSKLRLLEKEYEDLLIDDSKIATTKLKATDPSKKHVSHLENEIHKVMVQWNEAELVKKKYSSIRHALVEDSVKFESSLSHIAVLLHKQMDEIMKLEKVREVANEMRLRATAATMNASGHAQDAEEGRAAERAYFAQRFDDRKVELEKLEKRIFPQPVRTVVRQDSVGSAEPVTKEETTEVTIMENTFQKLMKLTGASEAEEVLDRFRQQRETSSRLNYLQESTEREKLELEEKQNTLIGQLEAFKFAQVKDKDEAQDQISDLKDKILQEDEKCSQLESKVEDVNKLLIEIKKMLYDLCKLLDIISEPPVPEFTLSPRDVFDIIYCLKERHLCACTKARDILLRSGDDGLPIAISISMPASVAPSAGQSTHSHSTPRAPEQPAYQELLHREPPRQPVSDEEEDIPSRSYLKRQAQLIIDTKSRRKGFRPPFPKK